MIIYIPHEIHYILCNSFHCSFEFSDFIFYWVYFYKPLIDKQLSSMD